MADGVTIDNGANPDFTSATDEVGVNGGSVGHVQYVKLVDGTNGGTQGIVGDSTNGLDVDVTRVIPGTTATALGKAEDAVHASGDTGVMALAVRADTAAATAANGDYAPLLVDASGRLHVVTGAEVPGTGATNLGKAEDAVHASGDTGVMVLAVRQDTLAALAGTTGDYIPLTTDALGRLRIQGAHLEDDAHASGDPGMQVLAVRRDTAAASSGTTGDYEPLQTDALGRLRVTGPVLEDAAAANGDPGFPAFAVRRDAATVSSGTDGDYEPLQTDALGRLRVTGPFLEDAVAGDGDAGFPLLAVRRDTPATDAGTAGDYSRLSVDSLGRLRTVSDDNLSVVHMAALAASQVVKASAGRLLSIVGYIASGEDGWIQVHDATSAPADTAVPEISYFVGAVSAHQSVNIRLPGHVCGTGITLVWSTTGPTKTAGASKMMVAAHYE